MKKIKVFSDFACPFCYIGFSIAHRLIEENPEVEFYWYPYELDSETDINGVLLEVSIPMNQIEMGYKRIERLGAEYGLKYNNKTNNYNTGLLHRAALYAQDVGGFYPFAKEAFKAIFEENKNVGLKEIVNEIGIRAGINIHEMMKSIEDGCYEDRINEAKELAVTYKIENVPTFIKEDGKKYHF